MGVVENTQLVAICCHLVAIVEFQLHSSYLFVSRSRLTRPSWLAANFDHNHIAVHAALLYCLEPETVLTIDLIDYTTLVRSIGWIDRIDGYNGTVRLCCYDHVHTQALKKQAKGCGCTQECSLVMKLD